MAWAASKRGIHTCGVATGVTNKAMNWVFCGPTSFVSEWCVCKVTLVTTCPTGIKGITFHSLW